MKGQLVIEYDALKCVWTNGNLLAKVMQDERKAHAKKGFFFNFGSLESLSFNRYCKEVERTAGFMMGAARDQGLSVRVFPNANGQIACELIGGGK